MLIAAMLLCVATTAPAAPIQSAAPTVETAPVANADDAADDPCIWVHPESPELSVVIGTDKKGGIAVYALDGSELQYLADGPMNNVDIRQDVHLPGMTTSADIVVASDRSDDSLAIYKVDRVSRKLVKAGSQATDMRLIYGLCMYRSAKSGVVYVFVTSETGELQQWQLGAKDNSILATKVRALNLKSKSEGCVADDELGVVYVAEEETGIWRLHAEPDGGDTLTLIDPVAPHGHVHADVEGLAIARTGRDSGFLIASSQGNSTFAVYTRKAPNAYVASFSIAGSATIDDVSGTDGIDVTTSPLGPAFPAGVFIAQDDNNDGSNQNFKLVPVQSISALTP